MSRAVLLQGSDGGRPFWALVRPVAPGRLTGLKLTDIARRAVIMVQGYGAPGAEDIRRAVRRGWITPEEAAHL